MDDTQRERAKAAIRAAIRGSEGFARKAHPHFVQGDWCWYVGGKGGHPGERRVPDVVDLAGLAYSLLAELYRSVESPKWDGTGNGVHSGRLCARLSRDVAGTWHASLSVEPHWESWGEGE